VNEALNRKVTELQDDLKEVELMGQDVEKRLNSELNLAVDKL